MNTSTRLKLLGAVVGVAAAIGVSAPAQALSDYGDVYAKWLGDNANGYPVQVSATEQAPDPGTVNGGVFRFERSPSSAQDDFDGVLVTNNPVNQFIGICMETSEYIPNSPTYATYTIRDVADAPIDGSQNATVMGAQRASDVAKLVTLAFNGFLANALTAGQTTVLAFQMALWELSIDRTAGAYDISSGFFQVSSADATANTQAADWLKALWDDQTANTIARAQNLLAMTRGGEFQDPDAQDILVQTVPLPAAAWLLGSGLIGLFGISRRRKVVAA